MQNTDKHRWPQMNTDPRRNEEERARLKLSLSYPCSSVFICGKSLFNSRSFAMRHWYFNFAAVLGVLALAALGGKLLSGDKAADVNAPPDAKIAKSRIDKVVVYPNSALVTREVDVPEGNGLTELVVAPMPEQIVPSTMYSEAGDGIRVLTTRFSTRQVLEDTSVERRKLETEQEKYQVIGAK